jgi:hypothetical protein
MSASLNVLSKSRKSTKLSSPTPPLIALACWLR